MFSFKKINFSKKTESILNWIASNSLVGDYVILELDEKIITLVSNNNKLVVCPSVPYEIKQGLLSPAFVITDKTDFVSRYLQGLLVIYQDSTLSVFENPKRHKTLLPIRFGLAEIEKNELLAIARESLVVLLNLDNLESSNDKILGQSDRLRLPSGAGVALWVEGVVRGSIIIDSGLTLSESVIRAIKLASRDLRFKPITFDEVSKAQIEITIIGELKVESTEAVIEYTNGYLAISEQGRGWYIPEVFNCRNFFNYEDFKSSLLFDKARLSVNSNYKILSFAVEDFIESAGGAFTLKGPIICKKHPKSINSEAVSEMAEAAAKWICVLQEADGCVPAAYDVLSGRSKQVVDWPRLTFTAWALAEYGKYSGADEYISAARKAYLYFEKYFIHEIPVNVEASRLAIAYAYAGNYLLAAGNIPAAKIIKEKLVGIDESALQTISAINTLSFRVRLVKNGEGTYETLLDSFHNLVSRFNKEKNNLSTEIATYPELAVVASELYKYYKDIRYKEIADEIFLWLKKHQRKDGAFAASVRGGQPYTRGTTKIFEVLALESEVNKESIHLALDWIWSMQYDANNTFYIRKNSIPYVTGSFRSSVGNTDAWIDSAAHFIIGVSRMSLDRELI